MKFEFGNFLARAVSNLFLPPFVLVYAIVSLLLLSNQSDAFAKALFIAGFFGVVLPMLVFFILWKYGKIDDQDTLKKEQRRMPFAAGIILMLTGFFLSVHFRLPKAVPGVWLTYAIGNAALFISTYSVKISAHLLFLTAVSANLFLSFPVTGVASLPCIVILAWARYKLKCHTPAELLLGCITGGIISVLVSLVY